MHRVLLALAGLALSCASARPPPAPARPKPPVPLEDFLATRRYGTALSNGMSFSADEGLVAYQSTAGGRFDIWVQPVVGGPARQVTHVQGFIGGFAFSPAEDVLAYEADVGGDELPHLFLTDSNGAAPRDITADYPKGRRTQFIEWARDGKTFLYLSNLRDERYLDLLEHHLATGKSEVLWEASGKLAFGVADRAHRRFALVETNSDSDTNVYLLDRGQKDPVLLTAHQGDAQVQPQDFNRGGSAVYVTSDSSGEFSGLFSIDIGSRKVTPVLQPSWDVDGGGESWTSRFLIAAVNEDGTEKLVVRDLATGKDVKLPEPPMHGGWFPMTTSPGDRYLAVMLRTDAAPQTPYVIDLESGTARKLDEPLPPSLRGRRMAAGEIARIPSFDGREVPAFLYRPGGTGPFPAVIDVHGGPTSQSRRTFNPFRQYLVSKGYAVLVPNVRGSTGYGKSYTRLDNHDLGGGPLKDVIACKWWLVGNADVADDRVVVLGGSYGGYMALSAEAFAPEEFAANVDYFGVSDLKTLVESFPPYWAAFATAIHKKFGNPADPADAKYQHDRSPIHFVDRMKRPLLVVQGDHDARVKKDQSDRIVEVLRKRGVPVHYLVLENEGHGFSRNESYLTAFRATDLFLDRYLLGDSSAQVPGQ